MMLKIGREKLKQRRLSNKTEMSQISDFKFLNMKPTDNRRREKYQSGLKFTCKMEPFFILSR